jgi:hypothetical protein
MALATSMSDVTGHYCDECDKPIRTDEQFIVGLTGVTVHADCLAEARDKQREQEERWPHKT